jgi:hypothetical protein
VLREVLVPYQASSIALVGLMMEDYMVIWTVVLRPRGTVRYMTIAAQPDNRSRLCLAAGDSRKQGAGPMLAVLHTLREWKHICLRARGYTNGQKSEPSA